MKPDQSRDPRKTGRFEVEDTEDYGFHDLLMSKKNKFDLIRIHFPELAKYVDKESIKDHDPVYIGKDGSKQVSDLVFEVTLNLSTRLRCDFLVLTEHQSSRDSAMSFRMQNGIMAIWNKRKQENRSYKKFLRPVIPLVIFTGVGNWKLKSLRELGEEVLKPIKKRAPKEIYELLLSGYADFKPLLWNLNKAKIEELLESRSLVGMVLACFGSQHSESRARKLVKKVEGELRVGDYTDEELVHCVKTILDILAERKHEGYDRVVGDLEGVLEEEIMGFDKGSYAEKRWIAGQLEGLRKANLRLVKRKFPEADFAAIEAKLNGINDPEELEIMIDKIAFAHAIEEIL